MHDRLARLEANRRRWDELADVHARTPFYDVEGFRTGALTLRRVEREAVGDVRGLDLLHLQCHFGLDTLSWARLGARVTGVDFSPRAIDLARELAAEQRLDARFVCADVTALDGVLDDEFDVVFASYGVLPWVEDLPAWGRTVARRLRPGGRLHLVEFHPFLRMFDHRAAQLCVAHSYFRGDAPVRLREPWTYADPDAAVSNELSFQWPYPLADVVSALLDAGLRLTVLRELAEIPEPWFPQLVENGDGWFRPRDGEPQVPLLVVLGAQRPAHAGASG